MLTKDWTAPRFTEAQRHAACCSLCLCVSVRRCRSAPTVARSGPHRPRRRVTCSNRSCRRTGPSTLNHTGERFERWLRETSAGWDRASWTTCGSVFDSPRGRSGVQVKGATGSDRGLRAPRRSRQTIEDAHEEGTRSASTASTTPQFAPGGSHQRADAGRQGLPVRQVTRPIPARRLPVSFM